MKNCMKCLALLGLTASMAFAHETFNKSAQLGFDKTYSAQSLKHGQLGITVLGDVTNDKSVFKDPNFKQYSADGANLSADPISEYYGVSGYLGMSFGMFEIVDVAIMLPVYYDQMAFKHSDVAKQGYVGNLRASLKFRAPLPEDQLFDIALILGGDFPTTDTKKRGAWVREPDYINTKTGVAYAYGSYRSIFRATAAVTMDLRKIDAAPLLFHLNGGYRFTIDGKDYPAFYSVAAGAEIYPLPVVSIFGEYYMDIADKKYSGLDGIGMNEASVGLVFHIGKHLDLQVGGHFAMSKGYTEGYTVGAYGHDGSNISVNPDGSISGDKPWTARVRTVSSAYGFGGITWSGYLIDPDRDGDGVPDDQDKCPDERGDSRNDGCPWPNPDLDEDGVCDPWVAEKGILSQFADICEGIDKCPNEAGNGSDGCPLDNPDSDADGVCDPWVAQKNMLAQFADVCQGIDECPAQAGAPAFNGCPSKDPDPDHDAICSPWVTDEGRLGDFADVCQGYDMCPGENGPVANKGCPWPDPDVDGDGLCDAWVTEKGLGYFFENPTDPNVKQCKGVDKCPAEYGPIENDGCPLENPDPDKDSVCSPWVSEKGMLDDYKSVCTGVDKCPNEAGPLATNGCPTEDPDVDKDGVCDPWVTQKGMLDVFKDVCTGLDKCPYDSGIVANNGCPLDNPDSDHDGVCDPWVTQKGMLGVFKGVCAGLDKCPLDSGAVQNNGCPLDNPDSDNDGVCDPWVTQKGMLEVFKDVCSGLDKCPYEAGSKEADGCVVEDIKLEVYFSSGKAKLTANSKRTLRELAKSLNTKERKNERYQILGYTDDRGKDAANLKLSQKRADAVVTELVKNGVDKSRLEAIGMGEADPIADNSTAEGRELNRRIMMKRVQ